MTGVGPAALLPACMGPASVTAVLLTTVAGAADHEQNAAIMTTATTLTKNNLRRVDHSRPDAGLDNGRRSCQVTVVAGLACFF